MTDTQATTTETIPVSHLSLDLDEPLAGWPAYLEAEGIDVIEDDLGRPAISRLVFGAMVRAAATKRKMEAEQSALRVAEAAQAAQRIRVPVSVPAQEGMTPYESLVAADGGIVTPEMEFGIGRDKPRFLEDAIDQGRAEIERARVQRRAEAAEKERLADQMKGDLQ